MSLRFDSRNRFIELILQAANRRLNRYGYSVDSTTQGLLEEFIRNGVDRMLRQSEDEEGVERAINNIERFIDRLMEVSEGERRANPVDMFERTRGSICPLWPFC